MTDSEKLDLLLEKTISMESDITSVKSDITSMKSNIVSIENDIPKLKRQILKTKVELKGMDDMILDEVERVHKILNKHIANSAVHSAC